MIPLKKSVKVDKFIRDPSNGSIKTDGEITIDYIDVIYHDYPTSHQYFCNIQNIPGIVMLFEGEEYIKQGAITSVTGEQKLLDLMGEDQEYWINQRLSKFRPPKLQDDPYGPGTILHNMLKKIGIKADANCNCVSHAISMNKNGPEWCENNIDKILEWLKQESEKRKIPFIQSVAKLLVQRAINKSKKYARTKFQNNS